MDETNNYPKKRFREIVSVAAKHGFKNGIGNPEELRLVLEELGPSFVKIGQILSTRSDIFPLEYIEEFQKLQDNVKPEGFNTMKKVLESELNNSIENIFNDFDKVPIASASLAEVYLAYLKTGEKVAIKIQRPLVKEKMLGDIKILKKLTPFMNLSNTKEVVDMKEVVEELSISTIKELDFLQEMENTIKFSENNKDIKFITAPKIYKEYCTEKVLVMEYVSGIKIDNIEKLNTEGYDMEDIATKLTYNYFKQVFEDGFFHADPHPGNIFIHENTIGYIDFGLMGKLDLSLRKKLNQVLEGAATGNINLMTESILKIGIIRGHIDEDKLYEDIKLMYNTYIDESLYDYDLPQILEEVMLICKENNISMPHNITLLIKSMMILQGVLGKIDQNLSIMDIAKPYFKNKMIEAKLKTINFTEIAKSLYLSSKSTLDLPPKILEFMDIGLKGRLKLNLELKNMDENFNEINKMVNRLIFAVIVAGLLVSSSLVVNANVGLEIYGVSAIGIIGYLGAGMAGLLLLISIFKSGRL